MITSDSLYLIGKSHQICQDYTYHGISETGIPYIIVADGCSTAKDSDIGARILTHNIKKCLDTKLDGYSSIETLYRRMGEETLKKSYYSLKSLDMQNTCLFSTLIIGFEYNNDIIVFMYGDGCIFNQKNDGTIDAVEINFSQNAPYYLNYWNDPSEYFTQVDFISVKSVTGEIVTSIDVMKPLIFTFNKDSHKTIIISTDGITSFINESLQDRSSVSIEQLTPEILGIKTFKGEFLKRRIYRMTKDLEQIGIRHYDDLGMAAFYIEKDSE